MLALVVPHSMRRVPPPGVSSIEIVISWFTWRDATRAPPTLATRSATMLVVVTTVTARVAMLIVKACWDRLAADQQQACRDEGSQVPRAAL